MLKKLLLICMFATIGIVAQQPYEFTLTVADSAQFSDAHILKTNYVPLAVWTDTTAAYDLVDTTTIQFEFRRAASSEPWKRITAMDADTAYETGDFVVEDSIGTSLCHVLSPSVMAIVKGGYERTPSFGNSYPIEFRIRVTVFQDNQAVKFIFRAREL